MDVEIYILNITTEDAVRWISGKMGRMVDRAVEDEITYLRTEEGVSVIVTPGIEGGPFLSITLRANHLPWKTSVAFARMCASELGTHVRAWDDENEQWLDTDGATEAVVDWEGG